MDNYGEFLGKVLDRRYKILDVVGVGGMAVVLKAKDLVMNRLVALKILSSDFNGDEAMEQRFINESKAVAMASHKNIVSIYDVAIFEDMKYIVMEFLDGITLKEYIDSKGILFWKEACFYAIQILRALEHAHSKGIVHRDIKPQNIMLNKNGEIKVTDFGIAKLPNASSLTMDRKAIGTVYYISPEQASGKPTDFHADLYSVGIMLYEMTTGQLPFVHENALNVAMMQLNDRPVEPVKVNSAIPAGLNQIILKAMEKNPSDRFQSAHGMLKAIELLYNNPDVVFTSGSAEAAVSPDAVDINSVSTENIGEIAPYEGVDLSLFGGRSAGGKAGKGRRGNSGGKAKKPGKKKRSLFPDASHSMFPIIAGVFGAAIIVLAVVLGYLFKENIKPWFDGSNKPQEVYVPNLVGEIYSDELKESLRNGAGRGSKNSIVILDKNITWENNHKPKGEILKQTKLGNVILPKGAGCYKDLEITVSLGPPAHRYESQLLMTRSYVESKFNGWGVDDIEIVKVGPKDGNAGKISDEDMANATTNQVLRVENEAGEVINEGDLIYEGSKVRIYVYIPNTEAEMPRILGMTEDDARRELSSVGLALGKVEVEESEEESGLVIKQQYEEKTLLAVGTTVDVVVSRQRPKLYMPAIVGLTKDEAEDALLRAGIDGPYTFVYVETDAAEPDTVMAQSVGEMEEFPEGTALKITLSRYPEAESDAGGIDGGAHE